MSFTHRILTKNWALVNIMYIMLNSSLGLEVVKSDIFYFNFVFWASVQNIPEFYKVFQVMTADQNMVWLIHTNVYPQQIRLFLATFHLPKYKRIEMEAAVLYKWDMNQNCLIITSKYVTVKIRT